MEEAIEKAIKEANKMTHSSQSAEPPIPPAPPPPPVAQPVSPVQGSSAALSPVSGTLQPPLLPDISDRLFRPISGPGLPGPSWGQSPGQRVSSVQVPFTPTAAGLWPLEQEEPQIPAHMAAFISEVIHCSVSSCMQLQT